MKCLAEHTPVPPQYKCFQTIGMNVEKLAQGRSVVTIWDLGGEASFRGVWDKYYHESHVVVFVLDASNRVRLAQAGIELGISACCVRMNVCVCVCVCLCVH